MIKILSLISTKFLKVYDIIAAIYIESTESVEDMMEQTDTDDERKPLLDRREVRDIVDQVSRLRQEEQDLLAESGTVYVKFHITSFRVTP